MTELSQPRESAPRGRKDERDVVSKRGRKLLAAIIVILMLALVAISVMLASLVVPRASSVARGDDAGGIQWVKSIYGWGPGPDEQLMRPGEVFVDDNGTIWVTDSWYRTAFAFNPEGQLVNTVGQSATERVIGLGPIAIGPEDSVLIGEPAMDRVRVFAADGSDLGMFSVPSPLDLDYRDGTLLLGSRGGFAYIDAETAQPKNVIGTFGKAPGQFDTVSGVCYGPDGTAYVVDTYNNRLSAYDADGVQLWSVETGAPGNQVSVTGAADMQASQETSAPARLQVPSDLCLDGNGRLVVTDGLDFSVSVFDASNGEFIAKYGEYGQLDGQFVYPASIDYDAERDWFVVADAGNSRLQIFRLPGSGPTVNPAAAARRLLSGPLRACLAPLILLLIAFIVWVVGRNRKKRQTPKITAQQPLAEET